MYNCQHRQHSTPNMIIPKENPENIVVQRQHIRSGRRRMRKRLVTATLPSSVCRRKASSSLSLLPLLAIFLLSDIISWHKSLYRGVRTNTRLVHAFVAERPPLSVPSSSSLFSPPTIHHNQRRNLLSSSPASTKRFLSPEIPLEATTGLSNYAPAATTLFNNMKLPAAVVTAGMISLGFATTFPELPKKSPTTGQPYSDDLRARCESLKRLHIVVSLIAVTSELVVVLWAAVEVNQLTEKQYALATSVWDLIQRDCDLAWSAVNSHFVLGIMGFVTMLSLRAYVQLLAVEASTALMTAATTGTGAALCLMISIVNRGVESGGGDGYRYGNTILDLFSHYIVLLSEAAFNEVSPGPLQFLAIVLELISLTFMANVLLFQNGKMKSTEEEGDIFRRPITLGGGEKAEECPVIDIVEVSSSSSSSSSDPSTQETNGKKVNVVVGSPRAGANGSSEPFFATANKTTSRAEVARCLAMEEEEKENPVQANTEDDEDEGKWGSEDTTVSIY